MSAFKKVVSHIPEILLVLVLALFPLVRGIGYVCSTEIWEHHQNFLGVTGYGQLYENTMAIGLPNVAPALLEAVHLTGWFFLAIALVNAIAIFRLWSQDDAMSLVTLGLFTPLWGYGVYRTAHTIGGPWQLAVAIIVITYICLGIELYRMRYRFEFPF